MKQELRLQSVLDQITYQIRVQLLEIYNEQLRDLLDCSQKRLEILSTEPSGLNVPEATQVLFMKSNLSTSNGPHIDSML